MKVRYRATGTEGSSSRFNTAGLGEVIVHFPEGDADSAMIQDLDVLLDNAWRPMSDCFRDGSLLVDESNVTFGEPSGVHRW